MKALTQEQIDRLVRQGCTAEDWTQIYVDDCFDETLLSHISFYGHVEIGNNCIYKSSTNDFHFRRKGISHVVLRNVSIGRGVSINNVGLIDGYMIGDYVEICQVNELVANKWPEDLYEEGITVGNEAGPTNIYFKPQHNEQADWLGVHYPSYRCKYSPKVTNRSYTYNVIGADSNIRNSGSIRNVHINSEVTINGASHLEDGELHEGCHIGTQVIAHKFSIGEGSQVIDGAKLYHVIATNNCKIGKGFTAENCYIGHHSELFCGEACAIFAGPHTVSHHKSTLLIGGEFSYYNAGSGTNQSNHAYKLGPIHHGTLARGSKTASGCHILWPMQTAPFTMIMGKIRTHPDLSALPFSYVIAEGETVFVAPGVNLCTAGTFRDVLKWRQRGVSPYSSEYDFLSPCIMQSVIKGIQTLQALLQTYGPDVKSYPYNGTLINHSALMKGLERYRLAVNLFASTLPESTEEVLSEALNWHWIDMAGLPVVKEFILQENDYLTERIEKQYNQYPRLKQQWGAAILQHYHGEGLLPSDKLRQKAINEWKRLVVADAHKEQALGDIPTEIVEEFIKKVENETTLIFG